MTIPLASDWFAGARLDGIEITWPGRIRCTLWSYAQGEAYEIICDQVTRMHFWRTSIEETPSTMPHVLEDIFRANEGSEVNALTIVWCEGSATLEVNCVDVVVQVRTR